MIFEIAGLGPEGKEFLDPLSTCFCSNSTVICDQNRCLETFIKEQRMTPKVIMMYRFKSDKGNSLPDVNQLH
jgi:hypothetical protein